MTAESSQEERAERVFQGRGLFGAVRVAAAVHGAMHGDGGSLLPTGTQHAPEFGTTRSPKARRVGSNANIVGRLLCEMVASTAAVNKP